MTMRKQKSLVTPHQHDRVVTLLAEGLSPKEIMAALGVTKNVVAGIAYRLRTPPAERVSDKPYSTTLQRLDALNAQMDAFLAEQAAKPNLRYAAP
jgi:hypothetical protein